jgi:hypothetical protein
MDVNELSSLSDWYRDAFQHVEETFSALVSILQNNYQQPTKLPITATLENLSELLSSITVAELSLLQKKLLDDLEVGHLFGEDGAKWINSTVRENNFDPASVYSLISQAFSRVIEVRRLLNEFDQAAHNLGFRHRTIEERTDVVLFSIIFQSAASIHNIRDWKTSASDWDLILGAVASIANLRPEDVRITGVQNGSIIISFSSLPVVSKILAIVSKHMAQIGNDYLDFQLKKEELRRSRMLSDRIEADLDEQMSQRLESRKEKILNDVKKVSGDPDNENLTKLGMSLDKFISFTEKGGRIDFTLPPIYDQRDEDEDKDEMQEVRELVSAYREELQRKQVLIERLDT